MTFCTERPPDNWSILSFEKRKEFINGNIGKFSYAGQAAASGGAWDARRIGDITDTLYAYFCDIWKQP